MSTLTELEVKLYTKQQVKPSDDNPTQDIPDTGDTGVITVETTPTNINPNTNNLSIIFFAGFCVSLLLALLVPKIYKAFNKNRKGYYHLRKSPKFAKLQLASLTLAAVSLGAGVITTAKAINTDTEETVSASSKLAIDAGILGTNNIAIIHDTITVPATENGFSLYVTSDLTDLVDIHNPAHTIKALTAKGKLQDNTYGVYVGKEAPTADSEFLPIYSSSAARTSIYSTEIGATNVQKIDVWYGIRSSSNEDSTYKTIIEYTANSTRTLTMQEMTEDVCRSIDAGIMDERLIDSRDGKVYTVGKYADGNCWMTQNLDLDLSTEMTLTSEDTDLPEGETWTPTINTDTEPKEWDFPIFTKEDAEKIPVGDELSDKNDYCLYYDKIEDETIIGNLRKCGENSFDSGIKEDGNYYSAEAATAGTAKREEIEIYNERREETEMVEKITATASICPANWHIATESEWVNMMNYYADLESIKVDDKPLLYLQENADVNEFDLNEKIPSFNLAGAYIGYTEAVEDMFNIKDLKNGVLKIYENKKKEEDGQEKILATAKINIYTAGFFHYNVEIQNKTTTMIAMESFFPYEGKLVASLGTPIRCVANYENYSLDFDANLEKDDVTVENFPESIQSIVTDENKGIDAPIMLPVAEPTRSDEIAFIGWATSKEHAQNHIADYRAGATVTMKGSSLKLYAVWDSEFQIAYPHVIRTDDDGLTFVYSKKPYNVGSRLNPKDEDSPIITEIFNVPEDKNACFGWSSDREYYETCLTEWTKEAILVEGKEAAKYKHIDIDESFKEYKPTSTAMWFSSIHGIESFSGIENLNTSKVRNMSKMFASFLPGEYTVEGSDEEKAYQIDLDFSTFDTSNVQDMTGMFTAYFLGRINGLEKWNTSNVQSTTAMFMMSIILTPQTLDMSNWDMQNNKNMSFMFAASPTLCLRGVEKWDTSSVENFTQMFVASCVDSKSLTINKEGRVVFDLTGWDVSNAETMDSMFESINFMNTEAKDTEDWFSIDNVILNLSGWNISKVKSLNEMFRNSSVKEIVLANNYGDSNDGWDVSNVEDMSRMFSYSDIERIYTDRDWNTGSAKSKAMFYKTDNLTGGNGSNQKTKYSIFGYLFGTNDNEEAERFTKQLARIDTAAYEGDALVSGNVGYFTNSCVYYKNCPDGFYGPAESPAPTQTSTPTYSYNYTPSTETPVAEEPEEAPVSTSSEKKEAKKSETEQEQTNPLGVEKSVEESSTVDTATIAVIVASFVLVSAGAVIIFMIERKRSREDGEY